MQDYESTSRANWWINFFTHKAIINFVSTRRRLLQIFVETGVAYQIQDDLSDFRNKRRGLPEEI